MPAPSGVRLRDSCQSCAASKTRCSKEKPQCNRCAKRGTTCHYLVTQRTGRKAGPRSDSKEDINTTPTQRPSVSRTPTPKSPSVRSSMEREAQPELSVLTSRLDALEAAMLPSTSDCFSMLMADVDFSASVQPYDHSVDASDIAPDYMMAVSHNGIHEMPYYSHEGLAAEGGADHDLPFRSGPSALPNSDLAPQDPPYSLPLPCDQLFQQLDHAHMHAMPQQQEGITLALQLMGQLCCLEQRPAYTNLGPAEREHWINTLADKCRKVTSTVSDMLQCHSSEDGYFLAVVCLVMSKVLDAYVQAAQALSGRGFDDRRLSHSSSSSTLSAMSTSESETSHTSSSPSAREGDAKAIQQLLDELYKVRASMDILGTKVASMSSSQDVLAAAIPFSPDVLNKLYEEQRKRLKTVSLQLINSLKAFWVEEHSF